MQSFRRLQHVNYRVVRNLTPDESLNMIIIVYIDMIVKHLN